MTHLTLHCRMLYTITISRPTDLPWSNPDWEVEITCERCGSVERIAQCRYFRDAIAIARQTRDMIDATEEAASCFLHMRLRARAITLVLN